MKQLALIATLALAVTLSAFPVTSYDYQIPRLQTSPVAAGMGGLNLSYVNDPGIVYSNSALLAQTTGSVISLGMQLQDRDQMDATEIFNASNVLHKNQIVSLHFAAEKGGVGIRSLANIDEKTTWTAHDNVYHEREKYQLTAYQVGMAETRGRITWGIGAKYLNGRLVYLKERELGSQRVTVDFIDDRLHGVSFDFSATVHYESFTWGFSLWDIYSHLWWMDHEDRVIIKRMGTTFGWQAGNITLITGTQRQWNTASDQTYHVGVEYGISMSDNPDAPASIMLRGGAYSHDFENEETTWSSIGAGYYFNSYRIDASMATHDMMLANTRYLITVSVGM